MRRRLQTQKWIQPRRRKAEMVSPLVLQRSLVRTSWTVLQTAPVQDRTQPLRQQQEKVQSMNLAPHQPKKPRQLQRGKTLNLKAVQENPPKRAAVNNPVIIFPRSGRGGERRGKTFRSGCRVPMIKTLLQRRVLVSIAHRQNMHSTVQAFQVRRGCFLRTRTLPA